MDKFNELLREEEVVLLDGAMGTMLMEAGLSGGESPAEWNVSHSDQVREVHRQYIQAGSKIILTNSFGGTRFRLQPHQIHDKVYELNKAAAINARQEADSATNDVIVAASMGPTGELLGVLSKLDFNDLKEAFKEQAIALKEGGADLFWVETMSDLEEVRAAIEGIQVVSDLPIVATMTFDTKGHTMMGVSPKKALAEIKGMGATAVGANCGNGPKEVEEAIMQMMDMNGEIPLVAKANAGLPHYEAGSIIYDGTPEVMAQYAKNVKQLGAKLIGACCGSTPDHVLAMAKALAIDIPS